MFNLYFELLFKLKTSIRSCLYCKCKIIRQIIWTIHSNWIIIWVNMNLKKTGILFSNFSWFQLMCLYLACWIIRKKILIVKNWLAAINYKCLIQCKIQITWFYYRGRIFIAFLDYIDRSFFMNIIKWCKCINNELMSEFSIAGDH